jgi:tetratricopeptide (TPR) repeat protein
VITEPALAEALEACHADREEGRSPAEAGFDALLARWPNHPGAVEAVAEAYDEAGDTAHAIACYRRALTGLDGTALRRCYARLGDALRRVDRVEEAIDVLHAQGRSDAALGLVLEVLVDPMPSPDLELFRPTVRQRAKALRAKERAA